MWKRQERRCCATRRDGFFRRPITPLHAGAPPDRLVPPIVQSVQILRPDPDHPLRKRLWQAGLAVALVILVLAVHETIVRATDGSSRLALGQDFLPVYAAGTLVGAGRANQLYAIDDVARIERQVVSEANLEPLPVYGPFLNPPFFAAAYVPLAALPYRAAAAAWLSINVLMLAGAVVLLCRMLPAGAGWRAWGLVPLLIVLPMPFWQAMCHQQNTFLSLLLLSAVVTLWRAAKQSNRKAFLAGVLTGLLFYKPQLGLIVAAALVVTLGWRALAGLCLTGAVLLAFTIWALPGALASYVRDLPPMLDWIQTRLAYNWGRQVTPLSFWRILLQGHGPGATAVLPWAMSLVTMLIAGAALVCAMFRFIRGKHANPDNLMATAISSMPLLMPYYMDYDLLLLSVPAVLLAAEWTNSPGKPASADRVLLGAWIVSFFALYPSAGLASHTRLNLAVPLIACVAGLSLARCLRRASAVWVPAQHEPARLAA